MEGHDYISHVMTERSNKAIAVGRIDKYNSETHGSVLLYNKGMNPMQKFVVEEEKKEELGSRIELRKGSFKRERHDWRKQSVQREENSIV